MENIKVVFIDIDNTLLDFDEYVKEHFKIMVKLTDLFKKHYNMW